MFSSLRTCRLAEVGKLGTPKLEGQYETGQLFLHRVFGYRGVCLFPWIASVYDRDVPDANKSSPSDLTGKCSCQPLEFNADLENF